MLVSLTVDDVMNESVETVTPDVTAIEAARRLVEKDIGSLVVCDGGEPTGIVTEGDITRLYAEGVAPETPVSDVMASDLVVVERTATLQTAARTLQANNVKKLPVCDEGQLVGIVTTTDLSDYVPHLLHTEAETTAEAGERRTSHRPDTAYENDDWEFEYLGHEGSIDVGDRLRFSKTISEEDVTTFAEASGDTNRLHLDEEYAAGTRFGGRIAHGTLVAGVISAALARLPGLIIYLAQETTYTGPVDLDERVTAECEVREDLGGQKYRLSTEVQDGDGETVIEGQATVLADPIPETA
ncbi:MAG: CBS domain-containing protein [Haloarculaceae archaeon]